jgi:two-component system, cell cycle sensor histidine kinase and response regulator CckA
MITPTETRNNRVLIIDDNPSIHQDFRKILSANDDERFALHDAAAELFGDEPAPGERVSFEIDSAFQGQDGLQMVQRAVDEGRPYALAFVDVRMPPGWDGVETISRIWKTYPDLQVVICTAYSDHSWEEIIRKVGKKESLLILKKPFDNVEVLQLAHALTEKWALTSQLRSQLDTLDKTVAERTAELRAANAKLEAEAAERERAQDDLRRSEERFSKAFRASPISIAIQTLRDGRFIDVNDSFLIMTGLRRDEVLGRSPEELGLWKADSDAVHLLPILREHKSLREFDGCVVTKSGKMRDVVISAEVFDLVGEPCVLMIAEDVSERLALERQLRRAQKLEAVGQLAAGVAHDFNNLLTVIQGHACLQLETETIESGVAESLSEVSLAAERAAVLTRQLLAFGRKQMVQPRVLDLEYVVGQLQKMLSRLIGEQIEARWNLAEGLPNIFADEGNVEQILVNLVVNARDAMPDGGTLTVSTGIAEVDEVHAARNPEARVGTFVRISVADTGCGMDAATLARIFEPFFTTKEVGKGTGLGLATVHGIVKQHEGWIEVTSKPGEGTTFDVFLPECDDDAGGADEALPAGHFAGSETILLVEDDAAVRLVVKAVLEEHGYQVFDAANGTEALQVWTEKRQSIQALVTDVVMPGGLSGCDLAERLRGDRPGLKVVLSSGYSRDIVNKDLLDRHGMKFVAKPYKSVVMVRAVRECLDAA